MIQLFITRESAKVYFVTEESFVDKVENELEPYIEVTKVDFVKTNEWTVYPNDYENRIDDLHNLFIETRDEEPDSRIWYKKGCKHFIIEQEEVAWQIMNSIRMIRNLLRWQLYCSGYCYIHGGLTNVNGTGIAFVGGKKSGKTSSILSFLSIKDVNYVTNDDLTVCMDGSMKSLGWPRAIGIRKDTCDYIESLQKLVENAYTASAHPANIFMYNNKQREYTTLYFRPKEMCQAYGKKISNSTCLKYIIFPSFTDQDEVSLEQLSKEEAIKLLKKNIEAKPDKHYYFLSDFFQVPMLCEVEDFITTIIEKEMVICYRLKQNIRLLSEASKMVRALVD